MNLNPGAGKVVVAYLHEPEVAATFMVSYLRMWLHDLTHHRRILEGGGYLVRGAGTGGIAAARNALTEEFLLGHDAEWLFWVDSDMGFRGDALDQLVEAADPKRRPVVGGLCFAQSTEGQDDLGQPILSVFPTVYNFDVEHGLFSRWSDYPRGEVVKCAGTGAAFLLVHRSVLQRLYDEHGPTWFDHIPHPGRGQFSEDLSFCLRLARHDIPVHVHTGVKTSHLKPRWLDEKLFDVEASTIPTFAVVPTRGAGGHVQRLVAQLVDQGEADGIFVMDNGCNTKTRNWLESQAGVTVIDMPDAGIHEMWNRGLDMAVERQSRSNVAILNDDIEIGGRFLTRLGTALRSNPAMAVVGPNYDGRDPNQGVVLTDEICAGRYDGTGGLPGFAFMVRAENPYRFPTECKWWFGDTDLVMSMVSRGLLVGIVSSVPVVHVDGGGQTGDWDAPAMAAQLEADRKAFELRWQFQTAS